MLAASQIQFARESEVSFNLVVSPKSSGFNGTAELWPEFRLAGDGFGERRQIAVDIQGMLCLSSIRMALATRL